MAPQCKILSVKSVPYMTVKMVAFKAKLLTSNTISTNILFHLYILTNLGEYIKLRSQNRFYNNNNISLLQTHGPYTYKKIVKTYIRTVVIIIKYHNIKIAQINIILISTIAEWESEYKQ